MIKETYNHNTYMLDCATRLKALGHTTEKPRFFRANTIIGVEELLNSIGIANYPALVILTSIKGRIGDEARSNNFLDHPFYSAFVIDKPMQTGYTPEQMHDSKQLCKSIMLKIMGKMRSDRQKQSKGLHFMKLLSVPYQEVGPLGAGSYGVMFNFEVTRHDGLPHNTDDWLPEE